jgi:hypothetical protein
MEPRVQDLFFDTVDEHEQLPPHSIHNWIAIHAALVKHSIKQASDRAIQGVLSIRQYFQPRIPNTQGHRTSPLAVEVEQNGST